MFILNLPQAIGCHPHRVHGETTKEEVVSHVLPRNQVRPLSVHLHGSRVVLGGQGFGLCSSGSVRAAHCPEPKLPACLPPLCLLFSFLRWEARQAYLEPEEV